MRAVSVFEAKTKFSGLLTYVVNEEKEVTITKHGHEVAKIVPILATGRPVDRRKIIEEIELLSEEIGESGVTLKDIQVMRAQGLS